MFRVSLDRSVLLNFDWALIFATFLIPFLGLIVLYSAGYDPYPSKPFLSWLPIFLESPAFLKQMIFLMAGFAVMLFSASIPPKYLMRGAYLFYGIGIALLICVALFGTVVNGSRRWLSFGLFNLQPAEVMKQGVILAMARILSQNPPKQGGYSWKQIIIPSLVFFVPMALIMKQPDLGTAMAVGGVGGLMLLFAGIRPKVLVIITIVGLVSIIPAWSKLHDYQRKRVLTLFNPEVDPKGTGYHIIQSKIAVGSGELFGKGFLKGTQTQLEFLPEHTTDFIFSVLAEEWGFVGCLTLLLAYMFFLFRLLRVSLKTRDLFSAFLVVRVSSIIFFHAAINMGMVVGILPVVGIPLPLFSYGGSSVLSTLFGVGLVLGVSVRRGSLSR